MKRNLPSHSTVPTASGRNPLRQIVFLLFTLLIPGVIGGQVTLSWNRHAEASVNSYKVYYGTQSRNYSGSVPSTDMTRTVSDLAPGTTYYFTVTAINASGLESDPCPEVTAVTPGTATPIGDLASGNFDGSTALWTKTGNVNFSTGVGVNGSTAASFNAGQQPPNGSISQTFATKRGQAYKLSFDYGAFSMVNTDEQRVEVKVQGGSQLLLQTVSANAPGNGTRYKSVSFSFTADSDTAALTFRDTSATTMNVDSYVDNVRVEAFESAPVIVQQPASLTVLPAGGATFTVVANGSGLSYQWYLGSTKLQNATSPSYVIMSAQSYQAGSYTVTVSNSAGSVTSSPAILTVQAPAQAKAFANGSFESGLTSWTGTGNLRVISGTSTDGASSVQFNFGQTTPNGVLSQTFGTTIGKTYFVDFSIGAYSMVNQSEQRLEVKVQGNSQLASQVFTVNAPGNGSRFAAKSLSFVANSASTTVTFRDVSATTENLDMYLDNVRVRTDVTTLNLAALAAASKSTSTSKSTSSASASVSASAAIQAQADVLVVAQGGSATVLKDGASSVLANDSDKAGLSAVLETAPAHGEVTLQPDGTFTYQHDGGQDLEDSFTYRAGNDVAQSEPVEVKINISGLMLVEKDGADLVISFHTEEGVIYDVQYSTDSPDDQGPWKNLTEAIEGDGEVISLTHPNAAAAEQIFYRVQSQRQPTESGQEVSLNR